MSVNFTGITFPNQKVTPSDDATIRRAILADGVLKGCDISYSGSTLTMAAGQMIICGRQIRHPSAQNWAVVDATSGYARLLLTIDLSRTSSKDAFDQVIDAIEYAPSADGFPDLVQEDVNGSGVKYQVVACIVALGTGGISEIVYRLDQSTVYVDSKRFTTTATISTNWSGDSAPYTQPVPVAGVLATDMPHITPVYSGTLETAIAQREAWLAVSDATSGAGQITFVCFEDKPTTAVPIQIEVQR